MIFTVEQQTNEELGRTDEVLRERLIAVHMRARSQYQRGLLPYGFESQGK